MPLQLPSNFSQIIIGEYDAATEGGYSFDGYTNRDIALDMIAFSSALEPFVDWEGDDDSELVAAIVDVLGRMVIND